jgi:hypothetical protein
VVGEADTQAELRAPARTRTELLPELVLSSVDFDLGTTGGDLRTSLIEASKRVELMQLHRGNSVEANLSGALDKMADGSGGLEDALSNPWTVAGGVSMSVGFLWGLTHSGGLLASMLMGAPAWRHVDLLPVLVRSDDDDDEDAQAADTAFKNSDRTEENESTMAELFDRSEVAARDVTGGS